jgi:signal transduction histidine kinase
VAVEKARLYEELEARAQRLDVLQAISTAIVGGHDADEVTGLVAEIDPDAAAALAADAADVVQLVREALSNVSRHAGAATCRVSLYAEEDGAVWLEVDDDGRGFDLEAARGAGRGLGNLRGRAARLGGRAEVVSRPGEGTTVRVAFAVGGPAGG